MLSEVRGLIVIRVGMDRIYILIDIEDIDGSDLYKQRLYLYMICVNFDKIYDRFK